MSSSTTRDHRPPPDVRASKDPDHQDPDSVDATPRFRGLPWRLGNALAAAGARVGVGPIALLTTVGRRTGRPHTVPVVPVDHRDRPWLVAPYGPVGWVHNVRSQPLVMLRYGRRRLAWRSHEVDADEAAPVLKRYVEVATRARHRFDVPADAPTEAFLAEAARHPVFELRPANRRRIEATIRSTRNAEPGSPAAGPRGRSSRRR